MQVDDRTLLFQELRGLKARLRTCEDKERADILAEISKICAQLGVKS